MKKNIIFVFSGTGNSLWVAKKVSEELENCEIISMGSSKNYTLTDEYGVIGFVYPTYYRGIPAKVQDFVRKLDFQNNKDTYLFAIATCGSVGTACNATVQLRDLIKQKDITLSYAEKLDMFSNYIIMYNMRDTVEEETRQSAHDLAPIIDNIKKRAVNQTESRIKPIEHLIYKGFFHLAPHMDKHFNVSDACIHCGICQKVCPVKNIDYGQDKKPYFKHHCEQCLACLHHCPTNAINYKDKTQSRQRYTHPDISWKELAKINGY
ncbi:EFR1 family ferrodoxin [Konateibacter massiliensis]|uniref:EFR1 family ferrodoxin n=1 Tax=Konateibacter massiliensis TaxID=2002841 RepID=UPI000C157099|nr:EFR1 family ferrodoxin [Konateibacter massiliensis]